MTSVLSLFLIFLGHWLLLSFFKNKKVKKKVCAHRRLVVVCGVAAVMAMLAQPLFFVFTPSVVGATKKQTQKGRAKMTHKSVKTFLFTFFFFLPLSV